MSSAPSSSSSSMVCYNPECKELKPERPRKGWRLRTGELAELCDRCGSAYEEGRFCDSFHLNASGWRSCESCGKGVHCGCIVSSNAFTLLDPGGIECIACARKNVILSSNTAWPPSLFFHSTLPERLKDLSVKNWSQLAGSGPVPWRQAPSLFGSITPSEMHSRVPYEVDISAAINKLNAGERIGVTSLEKRKIEDFSERLQNGSLKLGARDALENGTAGRNCEDQINSCLNLGQQPSSLKEEPSTPQFGLSVPYASASETNGQVGAAGSNLRPTPPPMPKQFIGNLHSGVDSPGETQIRNARPRADARGRNQLLPRYWPRFTDQELQQISGDSNSVITPLFEKMLSASDAGRIGRLVLPKKCAEENETNRNGNGVSMQGDAELADPSSWSKVDKSGYIAKEVLGAKTLISRKRKSSTLGSKSKRLRIENEDMMELKLTWEEAQGLLRPPPNHVPSVVVIEGFEFEEYEDAPILGKPTIFSTDNMGEKIQWVQCEDCFKLRKLPADALLPSRWTCSDNSWDPERSSCSAAQELTAEELEDLIPQSVSVASKKMKAAKLDSENLEAMEGLDTLANLAIMGEGESLQSSSQATTKHPRHRPGCSCIVCIQPPSGKGPKHKQSCTCNVCLTVKRRFRTLMMRREKKQSEKEAETTRKKQQVSLPDKFDNESNLTSNTGNSPNQKREFHDGSDDEPSRMKSSTSPFKGQIDLNIQPEREDELSPGSDSGGIIKFVQDNPARYLRQQRLSSSGGSENSSGNLSQRDGGDAIGDKLNNGINLGRNLHDASDDHPSSISMKASASTTATG
ncbi:B3 domain-containing protein Os07g0563300 isoform X2 [Ziziphus jujuba]|uniref:B3 domain-containing protein Os07g0563300 isoform X2 n=1 Tax=Ziziphus jujuba TaxID=326968 RepID=A0ABM3I5Z0_ZIZJJ|nr:B3 domain-containing protein Os07g0563300 isoform X2 [Ziziphus jujuba]